MKKIYYGIMGEERYSLENGDVKWGKFIEIYSTKAERDIEIKGSKTLSSYRNFKPARFKLLKEQNVI